MSRDGNYWLSPNRATRRRFLALTATAAGTGTAFLVACSSSNNTKAPTTAAQPSATKPTTAATAAARPATAAAGQATAATSAASPAAATPRKGGELHISNVTATFGNQAMDPHISPFKAHYYWGVFSDRLFDTDHQKFEPIQGQLIEKWEQVNPVTMNMTVRQGVSWHDGHLTNGRAFTAKDAAYNLMRMAAKLDPDRKALFQRASLLGGMDTATAADDKTVKVSFTSPNAQFLTGISDFRQLVVAPETVDKDPNFKDVANFSGTGAFSIQSFDNLTSNATYVANPKYWQTGQPYAASFKEIVTPDSAGALSAFLSGQIHASTGGQISQQDRNTIKSSRPDAKVLNFEFVLWSHLMMNQTRDAFKDPRVRKALQLALNYKDLLDANYGPGLYSYTGPICSGLPGARTSDQVVKLPGWNPDTKAQDIATAKQMMTAAGFPNGKGLSFHYLLIFGAASNPFNFPVPVKDQLQKVFSEINITLDNPADGADFSSRQVKGDFDAIDYSFQSIPSAILEAQVHYRTGGSRNYTQFSDPAVDALIDKGFVEFDANARNQLVGQIEQKLLDDMPIITLGKPNYAFAIDPKLQGFEGFSGPGSQGGYNTSFAAHQMWLAS